MCLQNEIFHRFFHCGTVFGVMCLSFPIFTHCSFFSSKIRNFRWLNGTNAFTWARLHFFSFWYSFDWSTETYRIGVFMTVLSIPFIKKNNNYWIELIGTCFFVYFSLRLKSKNCSKSNSSNSCKATVRWGDSVLPVCFFFLLPD